MKRGSFSRRTVFRGAGSLVTCWSTTPWKI